MCTFILCSTKADSCDRISNAMLGLHCFAVARSCKSTVSVGWDDGAKMEHHSVRCWHKCRQNVCKKSGWSKGCRVVNARYADTYMYTNTTVLQLTTLTGCVSCTAEAFWHSTGAFGVHFEHSVREAFCHWETAEPLLCFAHCIHRGTPWTCNKANWKCLTFASNFHVKL